ncbi:hypothetical protein [Deinococcus sp. Arct2-2]|nr:hypothetical protein [Deinococcus sp. Arct2-2]
MWQDQRTVRPQDDPERGMGGGFECPGEQALAGRCWSWSGV